MRSELEKQKKHVMERIEALSAQDPFSDPERLIDNAATDTEANEESSHDRFAALVDELKAQVADIDDALVRIGAGTYGICSNCGKLIPPERLAILPTATLCLDCEKIK